MRVRQVGARCGHRVLNHFIIIHEHQHEQAIKLIVSFTIDNIIDRSSYVVYDVRTIYVDPTWHLQHFIEYHATLVLDRT